MEDKRMYYLMENLLPDTPIFHYMDLDYFIAMLASGTLYVKRKRAYSDVFESRLPYQKMFKLHSACEHTVSESDDFQEGIQLYDDFKKSGELLTSCWTWETEENYLMWNSYSSRIGVRIATTIDEFVCSFKQYDFNIWCGKMKYEDQNAGGPLIEQLFSKAYAYCDEREIRFYFFPLSLKNFPDLAEAKDSAKIKIDPSILISEVRLSPLIQPQAALKIKEILQSEYKIKKITTSKIKIRV